MPDGNRPEKLTVRVTPIPVIVSCLTALTGAALAKWAFMGLQEAAFGIFSLIWQIHVYLACCVPLVAYHSKVALPSILCFELGQWEATAGRGNIL